MSTQAKSAEKIKSQPAAAVLPEAASTYNVDSRCSL